MKNHRRPMRRAKVCIRAQVCNGDQRIAGRKNVEKDRDHDDTCKYRDEYPDALEEEKNFDLTQVCKDECQAIHDCKEPDVVGHCHGKDEDYHRDQFYAGVQALQQTFASGDAVIYQAFLKERKDVRDRLLDKTLFPADTGCTAGTGANFDLLHPFRYHDFSSRSARLSPKKAGTVHVLSASYCYDYDIL